jgi:hypothetical protein
MTIPLAEELLMEVSDGLRSHEQDPIGWLTSFVNQLDQQHCNGVVAERSDVPPDLANLQRPPVVLVVDCGTGETKLLLYTVQAGAVRVDEIVKLGPASSYVDEPQAFVDSIKYFFSRHQADMVLVAASAWLRAADSELLTKGNALLQQLMDVGVICKILEPREEGWLEFAAAEYVCGKLGLDISASWASGAGSTQMTQHFAEVYSFPIGNRRGIELIKSDGLNGLDRWRSEVRNFYASVGTRLSGLVLCISAVFHAAEASGLPKNTAVSRDEVCHQFDAYIKNAARKPKLSDEDIRNLSNVAQQLETMRIVVKESAQLCFVRDVEYEGANIRVTWSLGWYLELIDTMGVLNLRNKTLLRFRNDRAALRRIGGDFSSTIRVASAAASATGQVLLDLEQTAKLLCDRAIGMEPAVTGVMVDLARRTSARLEGLEFRFKTNESLTRKLKTRLGRLLERNRWYLLYIPRLSDVFHEVDDALRYTVVIPAIDYVQTTNLFLNTFKERLKCNFNCCNFWADGSTYLGINCYVTLDNFTFEVQFHTEESWDVKQNETHDIYEGFRMLSNGRARLILYRSMKSMWNSVPFPSDIHSLAKPAALQDILMEQLGRIEGLQDRLKARSRCRVETSKNGAVENEAALDSTGLCYRLIRGKAPEEFEFLAFPPDVKRLAWVSAAENLDRLVSVSHGEIRELVANLMGKPLQWVDQKLRDGYSWKVVVMPQQVCLRADWDGVFRAVQNAFPEIAGKILRFENSLRTKSFATIEQEIRPTNTFRAIKDSGKAHEQYIDLPRLLELNEPKLWQVRGFLFNIVGLNGLFRGDGHVYNEKDERQGSEFLIPNVEIRKIVGSEVFGLGR